MPNGSRIAAVFINCPFDSDYRPFFDAMVFTIARCGFAPRCALEIDDGGGTRIEKITKLISECPLGIHDISRTELDPKTKLPRFNMPFELGIFLGARHFGNRDQKKKRCLILDRTQYRYRAFISDIAGHDISSHGAKIGTLITKVRDFLRANSNGRTLPSGTIIKRDYEKFEAVKPEICANMELDPGQLTYLDLAYLVAYYLGENA